MKKLSSDKVCYAMSAANPPQMRVAPGETFRLATQDCYSGKLASPSDKFTKDMWGAVNPATGPVFVEGAAPGDLMRVRIHRIDAADHAVMCLEHGAGALADQIEGVETSIMPISGGQLRIDDRLSAPVRPMIGVIGLAPAEGAVPTGTPGPHGGNMDCKEIAAGSAVYLPVAAPGGLLAAGDIHALMGDGEVAICAAEVAGEVTLSADVLKGCPMPTPAVETADGLLLLASARTLDECERLVLANAHRFLTAVVGLSANQSARVMSLLGNLGVCQVVDPLKTMKFLLPKAALASLDRGSRLKSVLFSC